MNVMSLLMLFLFVFSVLGVSIFQDVAFGDFISRHANFQTLPVAYLTLFRCATGAPLVCAAPPPCEHQIFA